MKEINTLADYMNDEKWVSLEERQRINFEVELIGKLLLWFERHQIRIL